MTVSRTSAVIRRTPLHYYITRGESPPPPLAVDAVEALEPERGRLFFFFLTRFALTLTFFFSASFCTLPMAPVEAAACLVLKRFRTSLLLPAITAGAA